MRIFDSKPLCCFYSNIGVCWGMLIFTSKSLHCFDTSIRIWTCNHCASMLICHSKSLHCFGPNILVLSSDLLISHSETLHCFELSFLRLHRCRKAPYANLVFVFVFVYIYIYIYIYIYDYRDMLCDTLCYWVCPLRQRLQAVQCLVTLPLVLIVGTHRSATPTNRYTRFSNTRDRIQRDTYYKDSNSKAYMCVYIYIWIYIYCIYKRMYAHFGDTYLAQIRGSIEEDPRHCARQVNRVAILPLAEAGASPSLNSHGHTHVSLSLPCYICGSTLSNNLTYIYSKYTL